MTVASIRLSKLNFDFFKKYSMNFFDNCEQIDLNKLWIKLSPHSNNKKIILRPKEFLNHVFSFCKKNNIKIFNLLRTKLLIKQFITINRSISDYNFILFLFAILFKNRKLLNQIKD